MRKVRCNIFETNSSSTHDLVLTKATSDYYPPGNKLAIRWADTDDDYRYITLEEKVSYLVSHVARKHIYHVYKYEDLLEEIKDDYEYQEIVRYLKNINEKYEIVFPPYKEVVNEDGDSDLMWIININHQLMEDTLDAVLDDLIKPTSYQSKLAEVLSPDNFIEIGHD